MLAPKVDMNIFETILARRSVRQYKARVVDQTILRTLLEAAVRAPTAMHQEPWGFIPVSYTHLDVYKRQVYKYKKYWLI